MNTASTSAPEAAVFPGGPRFDTPVAAPADETPPAPVRSEPPAPVSSEPPAPVSSEAPPPAHSQTPPPQTPPDDLPVARPISLYRNPAGKFQLSGSAGVGLFGSGFGSRFTLGVGLGYGVLDGVLPGVRALAVLGRVMGAEVAATLTLTPPVAWPVTPFALGEVGRRFQSGFNGWIYGGGGGVYVGRPGSIVGIQLGWMFRRLSVPNVGTFDLSTPLVNISAGF